jgi:NAD(P)-dependent dehydrogenase (short-subunit alcohol dehydrogenase family)
MFGYFVRENEMFATPAGDTHARDGVRGAGGRSATTMSAQPARSAARQQSKARRSKRANLVHGPDGSNVDRVKWTAADLPAQTGRKFVITGASSGIGRATAKALAAKGAHVTLAVRDTAKGEEVARDLAGDTEVRRLDLADLASVHVFAQEQQPFDVLINNAGVMNTPLGRTADGFELQFGTNHLGHFALTNLLLPRIRDRVVVIASGAHRSAKLDFDDLNSERGYQRHRTYGRSKLANLLFASELQRRLTAAGSPIKAVSAHPGLVATNLQKPTGNRLEDGLIAIGVKLLAQDSDIGSLPTLYAATQDLPGDSYVGPDGPLAWRGHPELVDRSAAAKNPETARKLWEESERLTGVAFPREALTTV